MARAKKEEKVEVKRTRKTTKKVEEIDFSQMEKVERKKKITGNNVSGLYISYGFRITSLIVFLILFLVAACYFVAKSISITNESKINYTEKSDTQYKVYLKDNEFYEEDVLGKNYSYIANLIDKISIDYNYRFTTDTEMDSKYSYDIVGLLKITNPNTGEVYYTKQYVLADSKEVESKKQKSTIISTSIDIDYDYYNELANKFKSTYAVDTDSSLVVSMRVNREVEDELVKNNEMNNNSNPSVTIPLSQKAISINLTGNDVNNHETIINNKSMSIKEKKNLIISGVLFFVGFLLLVKLIRSFNVTKEKPIKYDKHLNKLLKDYDRLIVNVETAPDLTKYSIVKIKKFGELLDLHDNYREPIRFIEITKHVKSYFYIQHNGEIFIYTLKSVDLED